MAYDVCIIGAGLVGLGVARALSESRPGIGIVIVDKEATVAAHQSSHNSGVAHSGLYYRPGSLKARLCVEGRRRLKDYCAVAGIAFEESGKLVIATKPSELEPLAELERRGRANGLSGLTRVDGEGIREFEPAAVGLQALHVPEAGVVDFPAVAARLARDLLDEGAHIRTEFGVETIEHHEGGARIRSADQEIQARVVVNCAGLYSDLVAALAGVRSQVRIVPFPRRVLHARGRGEASRPWADLPGARSPISVPGSALHSQDRRQRRGRPERCAGRRSRALSRRRSRLG